ncbi:MAG: ACT domain-containing protein [Deltaproteobacteria bacterium]|nr:ACT domain-containing protein [Deltaproteobacteria bacterium]
MLEQITIFLENKPGTLLEVAKKLADGGINIRTLSMADTADYGVLRLIVDDAAKAAEVLKNNGFTANRATVIAVEVPDSSGGMAQILLPLQEAGINIEYLYAFVEKSGHNAVIIFRFDDPPKAYKVLQENGITVVEGEKLYKL